MDDVGANVGLLGHWDKSNGWDDLGIEPDPFVYLARVKNLPGGRLENCAVGAAQGIECFWSASANSDCILIPRRGSSHEI